MGENRGQTPVAHRRLQHDQCVVVFLAGPREGFPQRRVVHRFLRECLVGRAFKKPLDPSLHFAPPLRIEARPLPT